MPPMATVRPPDESRRTLGTRARSICRWVWDHYVPILMTWLPLQAFVNFAAHWDTPDYGFRPLGLGVFLTCLFPLIWLLIYAFCGVIARRNELLDSARRQIEQSSPSVAGSSTEIDDARRGS